MDTDSDKQINLSPDGTEIEIICPVDSNAIDSLKRHFSKWSRDRRCWHIHISRIAAIMANELTIEHNFFLPEAARTKLQAHQTANPPRIFRKDETIVLQSLPYLNVHRFFRNRHQACYDPTLDRWIVRPDYELAKYLLHTLEGKLPVDCRELLKTRAASTDPLERHALDGKILHEPGWLAPSGLVIILGQKLHHACKHARIEYRIAIAFEGRPLPHTVGVAIRLGELPKLLPQLQKIAYNVRLPRFGNN